MRQHFLDNGLDPDAHRIIHGVVGVTDGEARFPKLSHPHDHYGASAAFEGEETVDAPGYAGWETLRCLSLKSILADWKRVDLLHVDIQGAEGEILTATIDRLNKSVRRVVVGTHSRTIEGDLLDVFSGNGWILESEAACGFRQAENGACFLTVDGEQVWRNPRFS